MLRLLVPTLALCAATLCAGEAAAEKARIGDTEVTVTPRKDITFPVKADPDVASRELWFQAFDGAKWGAWQKLGQAFSKDAPVVWAPPEGHWRVYIRRILTSGVAGTDPSKEPEKVKVNAEFIVDRTAPTAAITFPAAKAKLRGGDKYTVTWKAEDPYLKNAPIALKWSLDGTTFSTVAEGLANNGSFEWTVPRDMTTSGVLRLEVADKAGNVGFAESAQVLVDSIRPRGRVTGPAITAKADVALDLDVSDTGPAGLTGARLWVSQDDGVSWTEGPAIDTPFKNVAWKAPADGRYRLYVVATDGALNVTPAPKDKAGDVITVDATPPTVLLASAIGISESTVAGPAIRRHFKPGDRVQVVFTAKDANLVPNSVSVLWQVDPAKPWSELGKNLPADQAFRFQIPVDAPATKTARVKVMAADAAGNVGEVIAAETFTIQTDAGEEVIEGLNLTP